MKKLTCELCGSNDFVKEDGLFVCQSCGTKYSVEEARKLMIEGTVDVSGSTVRIDKSNEIDNLLTIARRAKDEGNYARAADHYDEILRIDSNNWEANFYRTYCTALDSRVIDLPSNLQMTANTAISTLGMLFSEKTINQEACVNIIIAIRDLTSAALSTYCSLYNKNPEWLQYHYDGTYSFHNHGGYWELQKECKQVVDIVMPLYNAIGGAERLTSTICTFLVGAYLHMEKSIAQMPDPPFKNDETLHESYVSKLKVNLDMMNSIDKQCKQLEEKQKALEKKEKEAEEERKREVYWAEHKEEKATIENEINEINIKIQRLVKSIQAYKEKIKDLNKRKQADVPSQKEKNALQSQIDKLTDDKDKLSILKWKDKQALQRQIDSLLPELAHVQRKIDSEKKELTDQINQEISNELELMAPYKNEMEKLINRRESLNNELLRNR